MVSISAFQADDPGSSPGRRILNIKNNNMDELINKTDESEKKEEIKQDKKDIQEKKEKKLFSFKEFHKKYHKHL